MLGPHPMDTRRVYHSCKTTPLVVVTRLSVGCEEKRRIAQFWDHPHVGDVRQEGLICAFEIVRDFKTRQPFPFAERIGHRICEAARKYGLLTRPIGDVLVLMPPYCVTEDDLSRMTEALWLGLHDVLPAKA